MVVGTGGQVVLVHAQVPALEHVLEVVLVAAQEVVKVIIKKNLGKDKGLFFLDSFIVIYNIWEQ